MKKKILTFFLILLFSFVVTGCNNDVKSTNTDKQNNTETTSIEEKNPKKMTDSEIISELGSINNDVTDLWNNVFCEIKWYSEEGTSSTGETLDIDFVISNMDKYYTKVKNDKAFIDKLDENYNDIKNAYSKMFDKATILYNNIKTETPKANLELNYSSEIELFNQYQSYLWETIIELES